MVSRNHSDLLNIIGTGLADNVSGLITAKILRDIATDTVDTIFATTAASGSLFNVTADAGLGELAIQSGSGIRVIGGDGITTTLSETGDGSGLITIDSAGSGSGTMSKLMLGVDRRWDGVTEYPLSLTDSSGIMFKEGHNVSIDLHNSDGSGIVVINSFQSAFKTVAASGDNSNTWNSHSSLVSDSSSDTLFFVGGTGIKLDTDANNDAIRISVSGDIANSAGGSGTMSKLMLGHDSEGSSSVVTLEDASGILLKAGNNISIDFDSNATNGSGIFTFSTTAEINAASGTMSKLHVGATTMPEGTKESLTDGSGLFFAAGDNVTVTLRNDTVGSGIVTIASSHPSVSAASSSDNGGNTFIQDITLDAYGHITGIGTNEVGSGNFAPASASGTMSKLHLGATIMPEGAKESLTDGSGLFFAAGDNMAIELTNNDEGSGILTFSSPGSGTMSKFKVMATNAGFPLSLEDGSGLFVTGGTYIDVSLTDENNGSGLLTISADSTLSSGTMSRFHVGSTTIPAGMTQTLTDGSGLFFAAGDNMAVTLTNNAESGILTFASTLSDLDGLSDVAVSGTTTAAELMLFDNGASGLYIGDQTHSNIAPGDGSNTETHGTVAIGGNTHIGWCAGSGVTTGHHNTLVGSMAGHKLSSAYAYDNTFVGYQAGSGVTGGNAFYHRAENIIIGAHAAVAPDASQFVQNVIIGSDTVRTDGSVMNGNIVIGSNAMEDMVICNNAVAIGLDALSDGTSCTSTIAIGYSAGSNATESTASTFVGSHVGWGVVSGDYSVAFGYKALEYQDRDNTVAIGSYAGGGKSGGGSIEGGVYIGYKAGNESNTLRDHNELFIANETPTNEGTLIKGNFSHKLLAVGAADQTLSTGSGTLQVFPKHPTTKALYVKGAAGQTAPLAEFYNGVGDNIVNINAWGVLEASGIAAGPSGLRIDGTAVTATAAELNYVDGVTSNIQTQIDAISGSGTMSKFHIGSTTQVDPNQISLGDGSGLFFAAGSNMTITTTNTDGSGVITFAADSSGGSARSVAGDTDNGLITWVTSDNTFAAESNLTYDGTTLKVAGLQGNNPGVPFIESDGIIYGSGIAIGPSGLRIDGTAVTLTAAEINAASGTMSKLQLGATTIPAGMSQELTDGSGLFFAAGDNMTVTLTNNAESGIVTIASSHPSISAASTSDNGGNTFIQDITLDSNGHVTGIGTNTIPSGNYHPVIDSSNRLDASLIGANGNVSNTEYGYLASVSSDIQTQLDALHHESHAASGSDGRVQYNNGGHLAGASGLYYDDQNNRVGVSNIYGSVSADFPLSTLDVVGSGYAFTSEFSNKPMSRPALPGVSNVLNPVLFIRNFDSALASDENNGKGGFICPTHSTHGLMISTLASAGYISIGPSGSADTLSISTEQATVNGSATVTGTTTTTNLKVTGSLGIGTSSVNPKPKLDVGGEIWASGIRLYSEVDESLAAGAASGILTVVNSAGDDVANIYSNGIIYGSGISAGPSGLRINGTAITASAAELNYVDGVSSAIQTQMDAKAAVASPTFTGVVTTPRLVVTALAGNTGGVPHIDSDGIIYGSGISAGPSGLRINGVAVTSTAAELNIMDGGATVTTPTVAGADAFVMNDGGTMAQVDIDNVDTYLSATTKTLTNKTLTTPTITSPTITGTTTLASGVNIGFERSALESSDGYALEVAGQIKSSGIVTAPITASSATTVNFDLKQTNFHMLTMGHNVSGVFVDAVPGQRFLIRLTQDSTGSRTITWPGRISWARAIGVGTPPPPSTAAGLSTMYGFVCTSGVVGGSMYYDGFIIGSGIQGTST